MNSLLFAEALGRYYLPEVTLGRVPDTDPARLIQTVYDKADPGLVRRLRNSLLADEGHPYDSHPPIRTRLEYAASAPDRDGASAEPVRVLFDEWEAVNAHLMGRLNQLMLAPVEAD